MSAPRVSSARWLGARARDALEDVYTTAPASPGARLESGRESASKAAATFGEIVTVSAVVVVLVVVVVPAAVVPEPGTAASTGESEGESASST